MVNKLSLPLIKSLRRVTKNDLRCPPLTIWDWAHSIPLLQKNPSTPIDSSFIKGTTFHNKCRGGHQLQGYDRRQKQAEVNPIFQNYYDITCRFFFLLSIELHRKN